MPTSLAQRHVPRISRGVISGVTVVVFAVMNQGQCGSCSTFSVQAVVALLWHMDTHMS